MARKKKNELPSGNIRIQVYDYTDEDGKKHYKSFTAPPQRRRRRLWLRSGRTPKRAKRVSDGLTGLREVY